MEMIALWSNLISLIRFYKNRHIFYKTLKKCRKKYLHKGT